jgi:excisionase family DNA binding protein
VVSPRPRAGTAEMTPDTQLAVGRPDLQDLDLLTPDDVCALLKVKKSWVYDEVEAGRLEVLRLGKQLRFRPSDLARYLEGRAGEGRRPA